MVKCCRDMGLATPITQSPVLLILDHNDVLAYTCSMDIPGTKRGRGIARNAASTRKLRTTPEAVCLRV
jgi:hypothetical protein